MIQMRSLAGLGAAVHVYTEILSGRKKVCKTRLALAAYDRRDCLSEISQYCDGLILLRQEVAKDFIATGRKVTKLQKYEADSAEVLSRLGSARAAEVLKLARERWDRKAHMNNAQKIQDRIGGV